MPGFDPFSAITEVELDFSLTRFKGSLVTCRLDISAAEQYAVFQDEAGAFRSQKEMLLHFGAHVLKRWNLKRGDDAIPANADGMLAIPSALAISIIDQWGAVLRSDAPLSEPSSD